MNCADLNLLAHAYVDGELDVVRSLEVEQHAKDCAACAEKIKSLKALHQALTENELAYHAPAALRHSVRQMVSDAAGVTRPHPIDLQWLWKWLAVGATAVAILVIALRPAALSETNPLLGEVVDAHVRSLMTGHLADVLSSDKHTVKPWFAGKLDFSPDVKDFTVQDFPLYGGRLDALNGRTVAALVYQHNKHFINVFIWPAESAGASAEQSYHGYNAIFFDANHFHYALVSDMDKSELEQLAGMLGEQK
jgi:anti-sigma factor RsiW